MKNEKNLSDAEFLELSTRELAEIPAGLSSIGRALFNQRSSHEVVQAVLGFRFMGEGAGGFWNGEPQRPFRPAGLIVWGAPAGAMLEMATIGRDMQLAVSCEPVPVRFFAMGESFADIAKKLDEGIQPPAWGNWDAVVPGVRARIRIVDRNGRGLGPADGIELVMWGFAVR